MWRMQWTREHLLVALHLYLTESFGRLHASNPRIIALAQKLGRTPGSVNMKANNFASLDPVFLASGRSGLPGASAADRALWAEYAASPDELKLEMDEAVERLQLHRTELVELPQVAPVGDSEVVVTRKQRRHQRFFREQLLGAYDGCCAITGLDIPELNVASHIIPWSVSEARRADPTNGLLLNALLDRAFDRGWITFENRRLRCARGLDAGKESHQLLLRYSGAELRQPDRSPPDEDALRWHRENRFLDRHQK